MYGRLELVNMPAMSSLAAVFGDTRLALANCFGGRQVMLPSSSFRVLVLANRNLALANDPANTLLCPGYLHFSINVAYSLENGNRASTSHLRVPYSRRKDGALFFAVDFYPQGRFTFRVLMRPSSMGFCYMFIHLDVCSWACCPLASTFSCF